MGIVDFFKDVSRRHEELKKRIHAFRIPLSPAGQRVMGFVYFSIPVIGGYYIMQWAISQSERNLEGLKISSQERKKDVTEQNAALGMLLDRHKHNQKDA
ncbi:hypothetical protein B484DRAFT_342882 [Ochromonadaceae sp. CCMP2298]|nr:hypothetical protein B484DRAFT_342882 [Ochromonadaceae sp. CCMP2298]|mmetsp:Transcript_28450/g.63039  ORF Transcript_28450/g.63039 Transcript_28450/m.63039 type:complete len:99 (-) Transcript_28450:141-437(-)